MITVSHCVSHLSSKENSITSEISISLVATRSISSTEKYGTEKNVKRKYIKKKVKRKNAAGEVAETEAEEDLLVTDDEAQVEMGDSIEARYNKKNAYFKGKVINVHDKVDQAEKNLKNCRKPIYGNRACRKMKGVYLIVCPWNGFDGDPTNPKRENKTKLSIPANMIAYVKFRLEKWKKDTGNPVQLKDITTLSSDAFKQWKQYEDNKKSLRKKKEKEERAKNMCNATIMSNGKPCPNQCRAEKDFCGMHLPGSMRTKEVDDLEDVKDCPSRRSMYVEGGKYCTIRGTVFEWRMESSDAPSVIMPTQGVGI